MPPDRCGLITSDINQFGSWKLFFMAHNYNERHLSFIYFHIFSAF